MKSSLLQLKLKLGNMQSPNQVTFVFNSESSAAFGSRSVDVVCVAKQNRTKFCVFRCLVWPTAAINQWAEQERVLIDLAFQALLVLRELLVSQVMLKYTHGLSFSICILDFDGAGVSHPALWLFVVLHCCVGSSGVGVVSSEFCRFLCVLLFLLL